MIRPAMQDEAFLADVRAADVNDGHFRLWWLGQSGFLVQWHGHHLLLDPYLSDSLTRKYSETDKPYIRMTARVVVPCHYEMFTFNTADPREFVDAAEAIGQPYRVLRCGERWDSGSLGER
jgi:L-ascorbate metabolism protein UlaG (beta-lactamase superfamily)